MHYDAINFLLFFLIYGFLGFLLETVFRSLADGKLYISRGFLTRGFCPLYGICAILILEIYTLCELTYKGTLTILIIATGASMSLVTLLEYISGRMLDRVFHFKLWDYSSNPLNLHSYICLEFSLVWGILALLLTYFVNPVMEVLIYAIPYNIRTIIAISLLSAVFVDASYEARQRYKLNVINL